MSTITELVAASGSPAAAVTWDGGRVIFSRPTDNEVLAYDPANASTSVLRRHTGGVTGLAATADGKIFGCQTPSRRMVQYHEDGSTTVPCDQLDGLFHNFPTYASADGRGRVWFADLPLPLRPPGPQVFPLLDHASVLRLEPSADGWTLRRMTHQTVHPTVVAISPEGGRLYIADTIESEQSLMLHPIEGDVVGVGAAISRFPVENGAPALTGLDVSPSGTLALATSGGVMIMSSDGEVEASLDTGDRPTDVAIIDGGSVLVTTDSGGLLRIDEAVLS